MNHVVVSDVENVARRRHIDREFVKLGVKPTFFDAVMGKYMDSQELARAVQR